MLNVSPDIAADLVALAQRRGLSLDAYLQEIVSKELSVSETSQSGEEKAQAFLAWADSFPDDAPPLSDEAIGRAALYPDRW